MLMAAVDGKPTSKLCRAAPLSPRHESPGETASASPGWGRLFAAHKCEIGQSPQLAALRWFGDSRLASALAYEHADGATVFRVQHFDGELRFSATADAFRGFYRRMFFCI